MIRKQQQKLDRWAERELRRHADHIIITDDDGAVIVFGKYRIVTESDCARVYSWDREISCFSNKRVAMSWCTADIQHQYGLTNMIMILDRKKQTLAADIYCRSSVARQSRNEDFYEITTTKIQPKIAQYNLVSTELEKCVNQAKYIQIRGFNNETDRTIGA
jgi:hypothetical protein